MKKKKVWIVCLCILLISGIVTAYVLIRENRIESFHLSDYQKYIDACANTEYSSLDPIANSKDLTEQAEIIWTRVIGDEAVQLRKPFDVFYDAENDAWLVEGRLPPNYLGGNPHMIVLSNGKVLARWIDK